MRPPAFPRSVILCGVRDVRDYPIPSESAGGIVTGGSVLDIEAKSLRPGDAVRVPGGGQRRSVILSAP